MKQAARDALAVAYGRAAGRGPASSMEAQRRELRTWARHTNVTIDRWFIEKAAPVRVEERPALMAALCALGQDARLLCIARPDLLHPNPLVREVVEHVATYAGGKVVYISSEPAEDRPRPLSGLLDVQERLLVRLEAMRGE